MSVLRQAQHLLELSTRGRGFTLLTPQVARWLAETQLSDGLLTLFIQHTSASLLITENADPEVHADAHGINLVFMKPGLSGRIVDPADFDEASAWPVAETSFYEETGWRKFVTAVYPLVK